jgi:tetratricopeptide (TPR) repeat protein
MAPGPDRMCLGFIRRGADWIQSGNFARAEVCFRLAEKQLELMPPNSARDFVPLVRCHKSLLQSRMGKIDEGKELKESGIALLEENAGSMEAVAFPGAMARILMQLHEYRRAIPFFERAIQRDLKRNKPIEVGESLERAAHCYVLMGLKDQSAVPARAALKNLRGYPGDPRLPGVLITLGNALRESSPSEAENLYREAAEIYEAKAHLEFAVPVWSNLGVLCSKQGRCAESLEYYEKALHFCEQFLSADTARIGRLLNNMAVNYGRMGNFPEAHKLLDRALELLKLRNNGDASSIASVHGSRGLVLKDEGRDAEAVEMFQISYAERKKIANPDLESMANNLAEEIAALKRLGRLEEAVLADERLALVNAERNEVSHIADDSSSRISQAVEAVSIKVGCGTVDPNKKRASTFSKRPCALCGRPTLPFFKVDGGDFLCMNCWREEKSKVDPYFKLNNRLIEQVYHPDVGFDRFTEDEKAVFAIRELVHEVLNGGFHQYFYNSSGVRHAAAEAALERLNEPEALDLLRRARQALFAGVAIPDDTAERRKMIPFDYEVPGSNSADLADEEGSRFAELSDALDSRLMHFAKDTGLTAPGSHQNDW